VLGLLTFIALGAGRMTTGGIEPPLSIALILLAVGLTLLLIDVIGRVRRRENATEARSRTVPGSRGITLFLLGFSLSLSGILIAWTGILWLAVIAVCPPILFRFKSK
jgi:hypothetical protein